MQQAVHPDDNILEQYAMNRLSDQDAELVEDHVSLCSSCLNRLDEATAFTSDIRKVLTGFQKDELVREEARASRWSWLTGKTPIWAGAAFALGLLGFFTLRREPPANFATFVLTATRGTSTVVHSAGPFNFEVFVPESSDSYLITLVDSNGNELWRSAVTGGDARPKDGKLHAKIGKKLTPGQYFLRVSDPSSQSPHEYGIDIDSH